MARYIDADAMINNVHINDYLDVKVDGKTLKKWIKAQPTADVAPVIHAHKCIATSKSGLTMFFECSNCRKAIDYSDVYCKYCGARMDEEVER